MASYVCTSMLVIHGSFDHLSNSNDVPVQLLPNLYMFLAPLSEAKRVNVHMVVQLLSLDQFPGEYVYVS